MTTDTEYEEGVLTEVTAHERGWTLSQNGTCLGIPKYAGTPKVGDVARYYGKGFGYPVRGVVIDGVVVYYDTQEGYRAKREREQAERDNEARDKAFLAKPETDARIANLPEVLRRRIQMFRSANPDFDWRFLSYELMCCEQAQQLAEAMPTPEAIREFSKLPWEGQVKAFPALDTGHSGNSFGMMCRLAHHLVTDPEVAVKEHGALTALVGCDDYGCRHP